MNIQKAWEIIADGLEHGYEGDECEEPDIAKYIKEFDEAVDLIQDLVDGEALHGGT